MKFGLKGQILRYSLLFLNLFTFMFGIVLMGLGIFAFSIGRLGQLVSIPPLSVGIIVLGIILSTVSFFGCCGAAKENRILLGIYFIVVCVIIVAQVGVAGAGLVFSGSLRDSLSNSWNSSNVETKDYIQKNYGCCGFNGDPGAQCEPAGNDCADVLYNYLYDRIRAAMIAAVIFALIEIVGLVLAACFFKAVHRKVVDRRDLLAESRRINNFYRDRSVRI